MKRIRLSLILAATAVSAGACDVGPAEPGSSEPLVSIEIVAPAQFMEGDTATLTVLGHEADGDTRQVEHVQWSSIDLNTATVVASGNAWARAIGAMRIRAQVGEFADTTNIAIHSVALRTDSLIFDITRYEGTRLPITLDSTLVVWNGALEWALLRAENGELTLHGSGPRRYAFRFMIRQYRLDVVNGVPQLTLRAEFPEVDRGTVEIHDEGYLVLTSTLYAIPDHGAMTIPGGFRFHYRVPGSGGVYEDYDLRRRPTPP